MSDLANTLNGVTTAITTLEPQISQDTQILMSVEAVQKVLNRSRASVYRYANTDTLILNPPFDHKRLNPESRQHKEDPLMFHPNEVLDLPKMFWALSKSPSKLINPPKP